MNKFVRIIIVALLSTIFIMNTSAEGGFIPYDTYEYNEFGEPVETPAGYIPAQTIDAAKLGLTKPFDSISDLCYVNGTLYILDSGNGRIVELDEERKAAMVSNLLVVLCGNHDAQPIVNSGSLY